MAKKATRSKRILAEALQGSAPDKEGRAGKKARAPKAGSVKPLGKARTGTGKAAPRRSGAEAAAARSTVQVGGAEVLDRLWAVVLSRRDASPSVSHSARLLSRGTAKVAQKFGEEAVECLIEALTGNRTALIAESADVLYHLLVMWVDADVRPQEVWQELERREGVSGVAEKAARPLRTSPATTKIP